MSNKLKLIAIVAAAGLMAFVLFLSRQAQGQLVHPEPSETVSIRDTEPETTGISGDELPMLPFD